MERRANFPVNDPRTAGRTLMPGVWTAKALGQPPLGGGQDVGGEDRETCTVGHVSHFHCTEKSVPLRNFTRSQRPHAWAHTGTQVYTHEGTHAHTQPLARESHTHTHTHTHTHYLQLLDRNNT